MQNDQNDELFHEGLSKGGALYQSSFKHPTAMNLDLQLDEGKNDDGMLEESHHAMAHNFMCSRPQTNKAKFNIDATKASKTSIFGSHNPQW